MTKTSFVPYCAACKEPFQSQTLFDRHWVGPFNADEAPDKNGEMKRRCLTPDEMRAKGWEHDGRTWRDRSRPKPEFLSKTTKTKKETA